jgi:hypothetical protein
MGEKNNGKKQTNKKPAITLKEKRQLKKAKK